MIRATQNDVLFGQHIKSIRNIRNKSREQVVANMDISHQQLQKYEKGTNRIAVGRLYELAKALDVGVQELIPPEFNNSNPIFKGQIDSTALHLWSTFSDETKRILLVIMRAFNK